MTINKGCAAADDLNGKQQTTNQAGTSEKFQQSPVPVTPVAATAAMTLRTLRPRVMDGSNAGKFKPIKFQMTLTKEEIAEDFRKLTGKNPPAKPKRRPKKEQVDEGIFPGTDLPTVVNAKRYDHCQKQHK